MAAFCFALFDEYWWLGALSSTCARVFLALAVKEADLQNTLLSVAQDPHVLLFSKLSFEAIECYV